eukprot:355947-Chlamydomonas_euryale.AAC.10
MVAVRLVVLADDVLERGQVLLDNGRRGDDGDLTLPESHRVKSFRERTQVGYMPDLTLPESRRLEVRERTRGDTCPISLCHVGGHAMAESPSGRSTKADHVMG